MAADAVASFVLGQVQQIVNQGGVWAVQPGIEVGQPVFQSNSQPYDLTTGLDGSIWAAHGGNSSKSYVQQIVNKSGVWTAQPMMDMLGFNGPFAALTTGLDGSIWVLNSGSGGPWPGGSVQQIVNTNGVWTAQPVIRVGNANALTTGLDGSIWVANFGALLGDESTWETAGNVQQIVLPPQSGPINLAAVFGPAAGQMTLGWQPPPANGDSPVVSYTATVSQGEYSQTITTSSTSVVFDGLTLGSGPTYFTVTAANFAGVSATVGHFIDAAGNTIPQQSYGIGLATDGTPFAGGGFDCHGNAYSWEAMGNAASGGTNQTTNRIYGYSYTIPAGKTLASITLPQNANVRLLDIQMSTATSVNLSGSYTSWGIANGNTQVANKQGFDGGGYYYYSGNLQSSITWSGATFQFGPVPNSKNGQNNFVQAKGQSINLPQGDYGWLYLAGAAANGSRQNQVLTLTFTDGSTDTWTQSFSDWCGPQNYAGETIIQQQPNRVNQVGNVHSQTNYVYGYAYQIPAGKTLASVKLPNNTNNLGILGMSML